MHPNIFDCRFNYANFPNVAIIKGFFFFQRGDYIEHHLYGGVCPVDVRGQKSECDWLETI